jgi:SpoVK/Ycf46/Vps4 family AAA+-type ATPase
MKRPCTCCDGTGLVDVRGTGKTLVTTTLSNPADADMLTVDLGRVVSKYLDETARDLSRIFDRAERTSAILLFDESDALFGRRTDTAGAPDRDPDAEFEHLLRRLREFRGTAIVVNAHGPPEPSTAT